LMVPSHAVVPHQREVRSRRSEAGDQLAVEETTERMSAAVVRGRAGDLFEQPGAARTSGSGIAAATG